MYFHRLIKNEQVEVEKDMEQKACAFREWHQLLDTYLKDSEIPPGRCIINSELQLTLCWCWDTWLL